MNRKSNILSDYTESLELSHDQDPRFTSNFWRSLQINVSDHMFLNVSPLVYHNLKIKTSCVQLAF